MNPLFCCLVKLFKSDADFRRRKSWSRVKYMRRDRITVFPHDALKRNEMIHSFRDNSNQKDFQSKSVRYLILCNSLWKYTVMIFFEYCKSLLSLTLLGFDVVRILLMTSNLFSIQKKNKQSSQTFERKEPVLWFLIRDIGWRRGFVSFDYLLRF